MSQIHELIPKVRESVGSIVKGKRNEGQGYSFRGIDDVLNTVGPALTEHKITSSVEVVSFSEEVQKTEDPNSVPLGDAIRAKSKLRWVTFARIHLRVKLAAPDGTFVTMEGIGSATDHNGDKAMNKAHSAAYKYALTLGLCIPVSDRDLDDSDHDQRTPDRDYDEQPRRPTRTRPNAAAAKPKAGNLPANGNPGTKGNQPSPSATSKQILIKKIHAAIADSTTIERIEEIRLKLSNPEYMLTNEEIATLNQMLEDRAAQIVQPEAQPA